MDNETRNGNDEVLYTDVTTKKYQNKLVNPKGDKRFFHLLLNKRRLEVSDFGK
jgi:hypothetical protein